MSALVFKSFEPSDLYQDKGVSIDPDSFDLEISYDTQVDLDLSSIDLNSLDTIEFAPTSGSASAAGTGFASASFYGFASGSGHSSVSASSYAYVGPDGTSSASVSGTASGDNFFATGSATAGDAFDSFSFSSPDLDIDLSGWSFM